MRLSYNGKLKELSRDLRNNSTEAERKLWSKLRNNQLGVKFARQKLIGNYIVDFYCHKANLVIELDGDQHYWDDGVIKDKLRDEYLKNKGLKILRIPNFQVLKELDLVMKMIWIELGNKL